jgi:hypothetical protein
MAWKQRSPKTSAVGMSGDNGPKLDEEHVVRAWKGLLDEALGLLEAILYFVKTEAERVEDAFNQRPALGSTRRPLNPPLSNPPGWFQG